MVPWRCAWYPSPMMSTASASQVGERYPQHGHRDRCAPATRHHGYDSTAVRPRVGGAVQNGVGPVAGHEGITIGTPWSGPRGP